MDPRNDGDLVDSVLEGDKKAFAVLHERYHEKIFNYLYRFFGNRELAKDATQAFDQWSLTYFRYLGFSIHVITANDYYL